MAIATLWLFLVGLIGCTSDTPQNTRRPAIGEGTQEVHVSEMAHFAPIRAARSEIAPLTPDIVEPVREMYNKEFETRKKWSKNCLEEAANFDRVERKTLYPRALLLGKALHESMGCRMISATNGDGGQGYAQVTTPTAKQKRSAAAMVGLENVQDLDWKSKPDHHLALATVMFDDCERTFGRRDLGLLCYNMGAGGVRKIARKVGWNKSKPYPSLPKLLPHIWSKPKKGWLPNIYVQRVLAGAVMMEKLRKGEPLRKLNKGELTLKDIPGWNPAADGDQFLQN